LQGGGLCGGPLGAARVELDAVEHRAAGFLVVGAAQDFLAGEIENDNFDALSDGGAGVVQLVHGAFSVRLRVAVTQL